MLVDSHCHLHMMDMSFYDNELANVINNAHEQSVSHLLCVSTQLDEYESIEQICQQYPGVFGSVGIHPNEPFNKPESTETLLSLAEPDHIIAIGETGLDYYRTEGKQDQVAQHERFRQHIEASIETKKPLIIHSRHAADDTLQLMKNYHADKAGGVMHCFCENWKVAEQAMALGFYISISGIVTFKNAKALQEVAMKVPLDRLLIETDCPYLAPTPFRGKPNEPAYVKYVAEKIAELRDISFATVAEHSTNNFFTLFPHANR